METAHPFNLNRYLGTWREIARLPVSFEEGCSKVTASYSLRADGNIEVVNRCCIGGRAREAKGVAVVINKSDPSKLAVSFFPPIYSPYYVLAVGDYGAGPYSWSVAGDPSLRYLWILSRGSMRELEILEALAIAESQGYRQRQLDNLIWSI